MQQDKMIHTVALVAGLTLSACLLAYTVDSMIAAKLGPPGPSPVIGREAAPRRTSNAQTRVETRGKAAVDGAANEPLSKPRDAVRRDRAFRKVSDDSWFLDRRTVLASTADLNRLLMQARAVPLTKRGATIGVRITRISPGSLYERIGLQNGDVITRINARNLDDPSAFATLYRELRNERTIRLVLYRSGLRRTFTYDIR